MKISKYLILLALGAVLLASCKKDEEETTYKTLSGTLEIGDIPSYVNPGQSFHFEVSGVSLPEDEEDQSQEIIYTFRTSFLSAADTVSAFDFTVPDTVGTFTITAKATLSGYYTKSKELSSIIVSDKSITGADKTLLPSFTDVRDGKVYSYSNVDGTCWMAENLAYLCTDSEDNFTFGRPYESEAATADVFGAFYTYEDALVACPEGWRLPTLEEWNSLGELSGDLMADAWYNGERLWEFWPEVKISNKYNLFALPFGYATVVDDEYSFTGFNNYAFFWATDNGQPVCRYIHVSTSQALTFETHSDSDFAASLRCVK